MEPHVFARFHNIIYEAEFDLVKMAPPLAIASDLSIKPTSERILKHFFKSCRLVNRLVDLLEKPPIINRFRFIVRLETRVDFPNHYKPLDMTEPEDAVKYYKVLAKASTRANELYLDGSILDLFRKLDNIKDFAFKIQTSQVDEVSDHSYDVSTKHMQTVRDLRAVLQHNWQASQNTIRRAKLSCQKYGKMDADENGVRVEDLEEMYATEYTF